MAERAKLIVEPSPEIGDLSAFGPKQAGKQETPVDAIKEAAAKAGMVSREPPKKEVKKTDRRRRTGRNIQLSAKISERAQELLNEIYESNTNPDGSTKWTIGQILELGLEALKREQGRAA